MIKICTSCGSKCDYRSATGLCIRCNGRKIGKLYGVRNFITGGKALINLPLNHLPQYLASYIAGLVDADGTVGVSAIGQSYLSITSKYVDFITLISNIIGGRVTPPTGKKCYQLNLRRIERQYILPQIIPFMLLKRDRAISCLKNENIM